MEFDPYGPDVLDRGRAASRTPAPNRVEATPGLVVEDAATGYCGAVVSVEGRIVNLEDYFGRVRAFPLGRGFLLEGAPIDLAPPTTAPRGRARTASGSFAVQSDRARTARASRILVEGRHDAELVEKVWGADLRFEGVVVEYLSGIDRLDEQIAERAPSGAERIGVLVDHLVPGSKEQRIADAVSRGPFAANVLVVGHPFIDVWQAVRPERLGIERWPTVPRDVEWKHGVCEALGWRHADQADIAVAWQRILASVRTFADLEPALLGRVEQLIDFVTEPGTD